MNIHSIIPNSAVNGPGNRFVIWTQGCSLNCIGCWNPKTHSFSNGNYSDQFVSINIYDLTGKIVKEIYNGKMKKDDYKIQWDGTNNFGTHVSAGVYLLTVNTNKFNYNKKLLFLK